MRTPFALVIAFAVAAAACVPAAVASEPSIRILAYGVFDTQRTGHVEKGERTASGELRSVDNHRLVEQTEEIVGQLGNSFGVDLRLENFPPGPVTLTIRTLHPPLTNPKSGRTMSVSEYDWPVAGRENVYFGYTFDHGWEIAEGTWTKQILYNGRVIAEQKFRVVVPLN
jgi:hypothetical protein